MDGARLSRQPNIHTNEKIFVYKRKIFGLKRKNICARTKKNTCISAMKMCYDIEVIDHIFIYVLRIYSLHKIVISKVSGLCLGSGTEGRMSRSR